MAHEIELGADVVHVDHQTSKGWVRHIPVSDFLLRMASCGDQLSKRGVNINVNFKVTVKVKVNVRVNVNFNVNLKANVTVTVKVKVNIYASITVKVT